MRILFVCLGNICRSPTAQAVLEAQQPGWHVDSAGTGAWHVGNPPHASMQRAAKAAGYDMSHLRARQFSVEDFARFDLIVGMDPSNIANVMHARPAGVTTRVVGLADYLDACDEIPDPYYTGTFDEVLQLIARAVTALVASESNGAED